MANKKKKKVNVSAPSKNSFAELLFLIAHRFPLHKVFDDFLTMSIASCTQNLSTKLSYYETEYLETIAHYKDSPLRHEFIKAFAALVTEMEERVGSADGNDVLGEFFEQHVSSGGNGQIFTPFPVCQMIATAIIVTDATTKQEEEGKRPLKVLDPTCGSGRMLLAAKSIPGNFREYYGIDIDHTCVKMAALNLFLNGMWLSEVMCADALDPDDFVIAYRISRRPMGYSKLNKGNTHTFGAYTIILSLKSKVSRQLIRYRLTGLRKKHSRIQRVHN